jgi:N-acetylglucosamine-6-phosphate deacetylase
MKRRIKCNNIIDNGTIFAGYVYFENGKITAVTNEELPFDEQIDAGNNYLSAGFIDTHTHGAVGCDFTFCTAEAAIKACDFHFSHGTTTILPTTLASDLDNTNQALNNLRQAQLSNKSKCCLAGVHIEGPYFAIEMAGAQNPKYLTDPVESDYQQIIEAYGNFIKKWSYAPERDREAKFCKWLTAHGILASAGHTNAVFDDIKAAYESGLRCVTHLYSCTSTITRKGGFRRMGVVESAYYFDDMYVELIADGKHLPLELINMIFKLKKDGTIMLVSDSLSIAGSDGTGGMLNGVPYIVEDGVAKLADRSAFAGSIATMDVLVKQCALAGVPLPQVIKAASQTPAESLHLNKGRVAVGFDAEFVIFDRNINVLHVIGQNGEI